MLHRKIATARYGRWLETLSHGDAISYGALPDHIVTQAEVRAAALLICLHVRDSGGTPDYWKWKKISDIAFRKASELSEKVAACGEGD